MAGRTQDEIVERYETSKGEDLFGFKADVLLSRLDFEHARPYLKDGVEPSSWETVSAEPTDVAIELRDYMAFAWEKARGHRGLSANRSVDKLVEMTWLTGRDDVVAEALTAPYPQYGAPVLAVISRAFEIPLPEGDDVERMVRGEHCSPGCDAGCGS